MSAPSITLTSVTVSKAVYDTAVFDIARAYLEGYSGDYYFFQYALNDYVLLYDLDEPVISDNGLTCSGCQVVEITKGTGLPLVSDDYSISGTLVGTEEQVLSAHAIKSEYTEIYRTYTAYYSNPVSVVRNNYLCYSSYDNYPHLIEGVQNYAFIGLVACVAVAVFKLGDRLFRRIY